MPVCPDHWLFAGWQPTLILKMQGKCPRPIRVLWCQQTLLHRGDGLVYQIGEIHCGQLKGDVACLQLGHLEEAINHPCQASARLSDGQEEVMAFLTGETALMA